MSNKRLLQIFISHRSDNPGPGIFEVNTDPDRNLSCTCPGFTSRSTCKHTELVERKIEISGGVYPFEFSEKVTADELKAAMESEETFRELVIMHGKVEVY